MGMLFPTRGELSGRFRVPFGWSDLIVVPLIFGGLLLLTVAFRGASVPFKASSPDLTVSLDPINLPYYGLRTMFRMVIAVVFSLLFTFTYATVAAKSRRAEKVMIPILDFLQSLPILGFLTVTTAIFLGLFRGNLLGLEAASIFAIFTSQVWNMTFSFYHSLITVPRELASASAVMRQSRWHRFWTLEVPFAMPGLIWNTMMSVSGGWFFVVASEVITAIGRDHSQSLPGLGSYIDLAIAHSNVRAMVYAAITLLIFILIYDQLIFRPIVAWAEKFKFEETESQDVAQSWMLTLLRRSALVGWLARRPEPLADLLWRRTATREGSPARPVDAPAIVSRRERALDALWVVVIGLVSLAMLFALARFMFGADLGFGHGRALAPNTNLNTRLEPALAARFRTAGVTVGADQSVYLSNVCAASDQGREIAPDLAGSIRASGVIAPADVPGVCAQRLALAGKVAWAEVGDVMLRGLATMARVIVLIALAIAIWTPVGVWIGLRPRMARLAQPLAQFAAAFPANLLFPVAVVVIARLHLAPNVFLAPLMVLGTQWYIFFNVIAGAIAIPNDLKEAARVTGLRGWLNWRTLILPAIFPAFVTGGITASGGSWNASIVAEIVSWGSTTLVAFGLGSYIALWSTGEFNPHVALGMVVMGLMVLAFNRLLWRRLYRLAETRFRLA